MRYAGPLSCYIPKACQTIQQQQAGSQQNQRLFFVLPKISHFRSDPKLGTSCHRGDLRKPDLGKSSFNLQKLVIDHLKKVHS